MLRRREADAARATAAPGHVGNVAGCINPMKHGTKTVVFIAGTSARNGGLSWFIAGKIYGKSSNYMDRKKVDFPASHACRKVFG